MKPTSDLYTSHDYLGRNPGWDSDDSTWKASLVRAELAAAGLAPRSVCDVGCGSGGVLAELRRAYPEAKLAGYDIAPDAARFWPGHEEANIRFQVGDFSVLNGETYDIILVLDVIEHVADPFAFLAGLRGAGQHYVFHFPLDLSAINVLRAAPLLYARQKVGHIHYYTKDLALQLLKESGFDVVRWRYTRAGLTAPRRTWRTLLAALPRRLAFALGKDAGVRLMGGETLLVLARVAD